MSLLSMPFLIINFGGEMIYVLEQRLHAQNIPKDKSNKVLQDVTRAMFSPKFIQELMKPQEIYSPSSTREIFDRLAHSSIMRLSESSMDKLYDLMTMGFKYQLVSCTHPRELAEVTLNHLDAIRTAVSTSDSTVEQVDAAIAQFVKLCKELSSAEFAQIRQTLAAFFQDKRIKVSLFLQDNIQNPDGTIALTKGGPIPNDATLEAPGAIRYYENGSVTATEKFDSPLAGTIGEQLAGDVYDPKARDSKLGKNLYTIDRKKPDAKKTPAAKPSSTASSTTTSTQKLKENKGSAVPELNALRELIGGGGANDFKITNLFGDESGGDGAGAKNRDIVINKVERATLLGGIEEEFSKLGGDSSAKDLGDLYDEIAGN